jgi:hypothetical protein
MSSSPILTCTGTASATPKIESKEMAAMVTFTDGDKVFDLSEIERGKSKLSAKEAVSLALDLASHGKALLGTLDNPRDLIGAAFTGFDAAIKAIKSLHASNQLH